MLKTKLLRWWYRIVKKSPADMPVVKYWKFKESVSARVIRRDGYLQMDMEGEDYPFPSFPRGHILFGKISKLKHEIKQVFNRAWEHEDPNQIKKELLYDIPKYFEPLKYDYLPVESMCPSVREIHRAWTKVAPKKSYIIRDYLCLILQEDDAYRFRVQWLVKWFGWFPKFAPIKTFEYALSMLEHGEVIGDMKERQRLLKKVLLTVLQDPTIKDLFIKFFKEVNWKKVQLSDGDSYHFRGKYFKVDYDLFDY